MKKIFLFFICVIACNFAFCQSDLRLGKRNGSILADRSILEQNIGLEGGYLRPIYFKAGENEPWQRIGYLGKKLKPYLFAESHAKDAFDLYQKQTLLSHALILPTYMTAVGFSITGISNYNNRKSRTIIGGYFRPNALVWLAAYLGSFYSSLYFNRNAEKHLNNAVQYKNGRFKGSVSPNISPNGVGIKYVFP